jgi:hypothetical protein
VCGGPRKAEGCGTGLSGTAVLTATTSVGATSLTGAVAAVASRRGRIRCSWQIAHDFSGSLWGRSDAAEGPWWNIPTRGPPGLNRGCA